MTALKGRKFLGVRFQCCNTYSRIYINRAGTHYEGGCPKCGRRLKIRIDPRQGVNARFFDVF